MFISLNILLTRLENKYFDIMIIYRERLPLEPIKGIKQLPIVIDDLEDDYLYVCDEKHPHIYEMNIKKRILCITSEDEIHIQDTKVIILKTQIEKAYILNELYEIYLSLKDWEKQLDINLIKETSLTEILEVSEKITEYPLIVYDPGLKVLAHSKGLDFRDQLFKMIIEKGYLPPEIVFMFEKDNVFTELEKNGVVYGKYLSEKKFSDIIMIIKAHDYTVAYIVMPGVPIEKEIYGGELLKFLSNKVSEYLVKKQKSIVEMRYMHDYLISDLFIHDVIDENSLKERLKYIKIPFEGCFYLMRLKPISEYVISVGNLIRMLESVLKNSFIFSLESKIYILFYYQKISNEEIVKNNFNLTLKTIKRELKQYHSICGISNMFYSLIDIRNALNQAEMAVNLFDKFSVKLYLELFCFYEDCIINHLFNLSSQTIDLLEFCHPAIKKIKEHDKKVNSDHFLILKTYLQCNEKVSLTAEKLNMHRNNVVYHLSRMRNLYHLDLEKNEEKFHIEFSIKILDYLSVFGEKTI